MMCNEVRKSWHDRVDSGADHGGVEEHLQRCAACRAYFRQMDALSAALSELARDTQAIVSERGGLDVAATESAAPEAAQTAAPQRRPGRPGRLVRRDRARRARLYVRPLVLVRAAAAMVFLVAGAWYAWTRLAWEPSAPGGQNGALVKGPDAAEPSLPGPTSTGREAQLREAVPGEAAPGKAAPGEGAAAVDPPGADGRPRGSSETERSVAILSLIGDSAARYVAVETPVARTNVTLYWLYPTLHDGAGNEAS